MAAAATLAGLAGSPAGAAGSAAAPQTVCSNPHDLSSRPDSMIDVGGTLFFAADDGTHGRELWKTDGTTTGTALVKDINPGSQYYYGPSDLTAVGETLFFAERRRHPGRELWKSDGTTAGTVLVKDINPGSSSTAMPDQPDQRRRDAVLHRRRRHPTATSCGSPTAPGRHGHGQGHQPGRSSTAYGPTSLTDVGGTLFFTADDGTHGSELWKSDGTNAGTVLVKDINPGDSQQLRPAT